MPVLPLILFPPATSFFPAVSDRLILSETVIVEAAGRPDLQEDLAQDIRGRYTAKLLAAAVH